MTSKIKSTTTPISLKPVPQDVSDWGKTVVLLITTHGAIIQEEDMKPVNTFVVPDGITIKRGLVGVPGVCNFLSDDDIEPISNLINEGRTGLINDNSETQSETMIKIMNSIKKFDTDLLDEMRTQMDDLIKKKEEKKNFTKEDEDFTNEDEDLLTEIVDYINNFDKGFQFNIFESSERILNKRYQDEPDNKNNWFIKVINSKVDSVEGIELMSYLHKTEITLQEIVDFLKTKEVKTIIIFDLSCSIITRKNFDPIHADAVGKLIRDMFDPEDKLIVGGKSKKIISRKKNTKNKKNKKNKKNTKRRK